ncbi:MAG: hypothetical protein ABS82_09380 [Rhodanobacter sp. SCN 67-45]|jgi:hypothetical protein|nr:MAG: hypothetical protein ABS82_09380 [Rhodanobacter sp. SCN 67-45]
MRMTGRMGMVVSLCVIARVIVGVIVRGMGVHGGSCEGRQDTCRVRCYVITLAAPRGSGAGEGSEGNV